MAAPTPLTLVIGNKNYSSWSLRPWLFLRHHGIDFAEIRIPLYLAGSKPSILAVSPSGKVPALHHGEVRVWDSLAILEYIAEAFPATRGWPGDVADRALARAVSAEMHSGFAALRGTLGMNVRRVFPPRDLPAAVRDDIDRIVGIWETSRAAHGAEGPFLFGRFTIADAMYAPVVWRFTGYSVALPDASREYAATMLALPAMQDWAAAARAESEVIPQFEAAP